MSGELSQTKGIRFVPDTLFFNPSGKAWVSGKLFLNGNQIGGSDADIFTLEEIHTLNRILTDVSIRHIQKLNS